MCFPKLTQGLLGDPRRPYLAIDLWKLGGLYPKLNHKFSFRQGSERVSQGLQVFFQPENNKKCICQLAQKQSREVRLWMFYWGNRICVIINLREYMQR